METVRRIVLRIRQAVARCVCLLLVLLSACDGWEFRDRASHSNDVVPNAVSTPRELIATMRPPKYRFNGRADPQKFCADASKEATDRTADANILLATGTVSSDFQDPVMQWALRTGQIIIGAEVPSERESQKPWYERGICALYLIGNDPQKAEAATEKRLAVLDAKVADWVRPRAERLADRWQSLSPEERATSLLTLPFESVESVDPAIVYHSMNLRSVDGYLSMLKFHRYMLGFYEDSSRFPVFSRDFSNQALWKKIYRNIGEAYAPFHVIGPVDWPYSKTGALVGIELTQAVDGRPRMCWFLIGEMIGARASPESMTFGQLYEGVDRNKGTADEFKPMPKAEQLHIQAACGRVGPVLFR